MMIGTRVRSKKKPFGTLFLTAWADTKRISLKLQIYVLSAMKDQLVMALCKLLRVLEFLELIFRAVLEEFWRSSLERSGTSRLIKYKTQFWPRVKKSFYFWLDPKY